MAEKQANISCSIFIIMLLLFSCKYSSDDVLSPDGDYDNSATEKERDPEQPDGDMDSDIDFDIEQEKDLQDMSDSNMDTDTDAIDRIDDTDSIDNCELDHVEDTELSELSEYFDKDEDTIEEAEEPDPSIICHLGNYAMQIIEIKFGELGGFGQENLPDNILGPPAGLGTQAAQASRKELLSLGEGGQIILKMGRKILDKDGPDFIVYENVLLWGGDYYDTYTDLAVVEVSQDGENWHRFPFDYNPSGPVGDPGTAYSNPDNFYGLAGLHSTLGNCDPDRNEEYSDLINPNDPNTGGGDAFDLADVDLDWAAYVRLIDTGHPERNPGSEILDDDGDWVTDWGSSNPAWQDIQGFDLDSIAIIHGGEELYLDE